MPAYVWSALVISHHMCAYDRSECFSICVLNPKLKRLNSPVTVLRTPFFFPVLFGHFKTKQNKLFIHMLFDSWHENICIDCSSQNILNNTILKYRKLVRVCLHLIIIVGIYANISHKTIHFRTDDDEICTIL